MVEWWVWLVITFFLFLVVEGVVCGLCQYRARYGALSGRPPHDDPNHVSNTHVNGGPPGTPGGGPSLVPMSKRINSPTGNDNSPLGFGPKAGGGGSGAAGGGGGNAGAAVGSWGQMGPGGGQQQQLNTRGGGNNTTRLGRDPFIDDMELTTYRPNTDAIGGGQSGQRSSAAYAPAANGGGGGNSGGSRLLTTAKESQSHQEQLNPSSRVHRQRSVTIRDQDSDDGDYGDSFSSPLKLTVTGDDAGYGSQNLRSESPDTPAGSRSPVPAPGSGAGRIARKNSSNGPGGTGLLPTPPEQQEQLATITPSVLTAHSTASSPSKIASGNYVFPNSVPEVSSKPSTAKNELFPPVTATPSSAVTSTSTIVTYDGKTLTDDEVMDAL